MSHTWIITSSLLVIHASRKASAAAWNSSDSTLTCHQTLQHNHPGLFMGSFSLRLFIYTSKSSSLILKKKKKLFRSQHSYCTLFKVIPRNSKWHLFCSKASSILMSTFFLPDINVSFPDIPFGAGPIYNWDFYLNSTLVSQICLIACLKTREIF